MVVRDFKKFFKRRGRFVRQPRNDKKTFQRSRDDKNGKSDRKCSRCGDPNHLIGECPKPPKDKNQRAFVEGYWSDSSEKMMRRVDLELDEWIKDSGCPKHMTGNRKLFSSYKAYNGVNVIFGSNLRGYIISKELNAEIVDTIVDSLSPSPVPVGDDDSHMEEIDLFLATDDLMPQGIENADYDSEGDIHFLEELFSNDSIPLPENESFNIDHYDEPSFPCPPPEPQMLRFSLILSPNQEN
nr:zf-CCHC domain-containing protein/UBN2 domain-containing protein [Tanacetum cinerariifolium]